MIGRGYGRCASAAAAWLISAAFHPLFAQTPAAATPPQATSDTPVTFEIPAQPLAAALNAWALQANAQVFVDPEPVAHLTAPAIKGDLAPRQALQMLLAQSNLLAVQGSDGVFVIKERPVVAAAPKHRGHHVGPATRQAPAAMAQVALEPVPARDREGPWLLRLDADYDHGGGSSSGTATFSAEYYITDHLAGALAMAVPRSQSGARLQTSALTLKYYFTPENRLRPYLGAGFAVTALYDVAGAGTSRTSIGATVQGGLDLKLADHWFLNADVSWTQAPHPDPVQFGLGLAYRF